MGMATAVAAEDAQFHILAVDDNLIDRKVIERLLKSSSFQVTTVDSGCKALEFLGWHEASVSPKIHRDVEVNLVITDYCMPGMTGYDLLKKMKESSSLRNIPVVIMSSENVPSRITRCLEEGAEEFLLKPVKPSDLNKLRPHIEKAKTCQNNSNIIQENQENQKSRQEDIHLLQQNNKKRKSSVAMDMEDGPDRTSRSRPSYNKGLTVMSN